MSMDEYGSRLSSPSRYIMKVQVTGGSCAPTDTGALSGMMRNAAAMPTTENPTRLLFPCP
jgi:hypothetical protein